MGVLILKESSLHYLQRNVDFLSYIAGGTMQVRFKTVAAFKFFLIITSITDFVSFLVPAICKYGALNGLSTETYETLYKYYVKNPYPFFE